MKKAIPAILAGIVLIAGIFAFAPIQKAQTIHSSISASTNRDTLEGTWTWFMQAGTGASTNGTLLANYATKAGVSKVTGIITISANSTANYDHDNRNEVAGTADVYSGNGTQLASASSLDPIRSSAIVTLGGNGLDLRANTSATNASVITFTILDVD